MRYRPLYSRRWRMYNLAETGSTGRHDGKLSKSRLSGALLVGDGGCSKRRIATLLIESMFRDWLSKAGAAGPGQPLTLFRVAPLSTMDRWSV
jgi:hypothetical protein